MPWSGEYPESHVRQLNGPRGSAEELRDLLDPGKTLNRYGTTDGLITTNFFVPMVRPLSFTRKASILPTEQVSAV